MTNTESTGQVQATIVRHWAPPGGGEEEWTQLIGPGAVNEHVKARAARFRAARVKHTVSGNTITHEPNPSERAMGIVKVTMAYSLALSDATSASARYQAERSWRELDAAATEPVMCDRPGCPDFVLDGFTLCPVHLDAADGHVEHEGWTA